MVPSRLRSPPPPQPAGSSFPRGPLRGLARWPPFRTSLRTFILYSRGGPPPPGVRGAHAGPVVSGYTLLGGGRSLLPPSRRLLSSGGRCAGARIIPAGLRPV
eukprot:3483074-Prymnesium_polylepis.1